MTETPIEKAKRLVRDALGALNELNASLPDEARADCEHLIGHAFDGVLSADGYLDTVSQRLAER